MPEERFSGLSGLGFKGLFKILESRVQSFKLLTGPKPKEIKVETSESTTL